MLNFDNAIIVLDNINPKPGKCLTTFLKACVKAGVEESDGRPLDQFSADELLASFSSRWYFLSRDLTGALFFWPGSCALAANFRFPWRWLYPAFRWLLLSPSFFPPKAKKWNDGKRGAFFSKFLIFYEFGLSQNHCKIGKVANFNFCRFWFPWDCWFSPSMKTEDFREIREVKMPRLWKLDWNGRISLGESGAGWSNWCSNG